MRESPIAAAAAAWYLAQREAPLAPVQQAEFLAWLRQSPTHVAEYLGIAHLHQDLQAAAHSQPASSEQLCAHARHSGAVVVPLRPELGRAASPRSRAAPARTRTRRWALGLAAVLALSAVGVATQLAMPDTVPATVYAAGTEAGREVALGDGSVVRLDRGSAIAVRYGAQRRDIALLRGKALFDLGHDPARPLRVSVGTLVLRDIGTVFGVDQHAGGTRVTVLQGRVHVLRGAHPWWRRSALPSEGAQLADLGGGQQARLDPQGQLLGLDAHADIAGATAWLPEQVGVHDRSVGEVARLFNAYTTQPLRIADPALAARRISGVFHLRDPEAFVAYLGSLPNVQVHRDAQAVTIRSAPAPM
ncbi:FecR domain-containing protein [Xanthomonas sp. CFBP 8703]|uniref:FecR domain-containing protein n=1 Tax=Xanthomonas bonasiae TaxID=2810351 RepID=A0ABS3B8B4_9XANT|nr:FecR domain-containing protein [Xanthomonas bonasiae]MBN6104842.1 FecR domain-containing protein [Xanthomonas bonasiae]